MNAKKKLVVVDDSFFKRVVDSPRFMFYSILVHMTFVAVVVLSLEWQTKPKPVPHVIQATMIDETKIKVEIEKLRLADEKKKQLAEAEQKKLDDAKKASQKEEQRLAELKKQREAERRKLKAEEQKRKSEEDKRKAAEKQRKVEEDKRQTAEQQRKAEEKKQLDAKNKRIAEEKRIKEQKQAQLEKLKAEEAALKEKQAREAEERIRQAEARKKQQELERIRQEEARIRQEQLAEEQRHLDAAREREYQTIVDQHVEIIRQKVNRNWLRPTGSVAGLACTVRVRIIPGGDVLDVRVIKGSGNAVFDRSVETAVLKASPLPLPADRALFDRFRELEFIFDPEG